MPTIPRTRPTRRAILTCALSVLPAAALAVLLAFGGCSHSSPSGPPPIYSSIVISGPDTVLVGQTVLFTATVIDTGGNPVASPQITYTSSAPAIASINNAGNAFGVSEGDVLIRATGGGVVSNVLPLTVITGRGWVDQSANAPTAQNLNGVHFVSAREGWIVGDLGTILHTTDAGKSWKAQVSNSTGYRLNAVAFTSPTNGIIVGSAGRVLRTQNGGTTWAALAVDTDNGRALNDVYFQDALRGWIVGNGGLLLRTVNGGTVWTRVLPAPTAIDLERVSFPRYTLGGTPPADPYGEGWVVGAVGTILGTHDFGQTWRVYTPYVTTDPLFGVVRRSKVDAIAVGSNNRVLNTIASADSALWQIPSAPTTFSNLTAVTWSTESLVPGSAWAVGKQTALVQAVVLYSSNGGDSWTAQALPGTAPLIGNSLEDVFFLDDHRGWAVGTQGLILHTATGGR